MKVIVNYTIDNKPIRGNCEIIITNCKMKCVLVDHRRNGKSKIDKVFVQNAGKITHVFEAVEQNDIIQFWVEERDFNVNREDISKYVDSLDINYKYKESEMNWLGRTDTFTDLCEKSFP
jgi:hypothetical protein